jgi:LysR family hydrogen peroxide-inducible transcriptional activator
MLRSLRRIGTAIPDAGLTSVTLFEEPFLAALPAAHRLPSQKTVKESDLATDLMVLADGHCLAGKARATCACSKSARAESDLCAASLETLMNLVAAGYATTLIPQLPARSLSTRRVMLCPPAGGWSRTIRLASRPMFPHPKALRALGDQERGRSRPVGTLPEARDLAAQLPAKSPDKSSERD